MFFLQLPHTSLVLANIEVIMDPYVCLWLKVLVVKFVALYSKYTHKSICKNPKCIHDFVYFMWFTITYSIEFKTEFLFASFKFGSMLNSWNFQFDMGLFSYFMVNTILIELIFFFKLDNVIFLSRSIPCGFYFLIIFIKYVNVNHNHFIKNEY